MVQNGPKKSFYVFLTSLLGIMMFVVIQRSVALIGLLLLNIDYGRFSLGSNYSQLHILNIITYILAVFLGGWYGAWLGLYWYKVVYEQGTGGLWHGLVGNFFHDGPEKKVVKSVSQAPKVQPKAQPKVIGTPRAVDSVEAAQPWEFDDLLSSKGARAIASLKPRIFTKEIEASADKELETVKPTSVRRVRKTSSAKRATGTSVKRRATTRSKVREMPEKETI
jgi:signal transduction histidine kinase